jgi:hypothetical protein
MPSARAGYHIQGALWLERTAPGAITQPTAGRRTMGHEREVQKEKKKQPQKSLKERRAEKKAKKAGAGTGI